MLIYQPALLEQVNDHLQNNIYQNTIQNLFVICLFFGNSYLKKRQCRDSRYIRKSCHVSKNVMLAIY